MIRHIVIWELKDEYSEEEKKEYAKTYKPMIEGLVGKIPGLLTSECIIDLIDSSTYDLMLISDFDSNESLLAYRKNPQHIEVATYIRSKVKNRVCMDYEI